MVFFCSQFWFFFCFCTVLATVQPDGGGVGRPERVRVHRGGLPAGPQRPGAGLQPGVLRGQHHRGDRVQEQAAAAGSAEERDPVVEEAAFRYLHVLLLVRFFILSLVEHVS